ncbi:hypothetical protein Tsubulata_011409 [Turnera subulata]|uniref:Uncharacterized protein n=1 Tax=Turnera subulata TaxID=218843 RepID=A0A9Q0JIP0_9ROSI|nr:hypothetical protein Tsubulata_011409 [Turnera subulata]
MGYSKQQIDSQVVPNNNGIQIQDNSLRLYQPPFSNHSMLPYIKITPVDEEEEEEVMVRPEFQISEQRFTRRPWV